MKIEIKKSQTADTRTCDWSKVSKKQLLQSSKQHIEDVKKGLNYIEKLLREKAQNHDYTKISGIDEFYSDFKTGFKRTGWWEKHQKEERHHFNNPKYIQDDVNLLDIIEQIIDGVMAGMARGGEHRYEPLSNELLQKAYYNTIKMLLDRVKVKK